MGVQILAIMLFHFTEDCALRDVHFSGFISKYYKYIGSSGVDIFLMLSGVGLYYSWKRNPDHRIFYKRRFMRLLIPYVLVAVPALLLQDIVASGKGWVCFLKDVTFVSFFESGRKWFWYILLMGVCYLIYPYLFEIIEQAQDRVTEKMRILLLCTVCTVVALYLKLYEETLYNNIAIALYRFPAFFVGCLLGRSVYEKREMPAWKPWLWAALACTALAPLGLVETPVLRVYLLAFFNLSCCFLFLQLMEWMTERESGIIRSAYNKLKEILEWFGRYSLELYLVHVTVRRIMKYIGYPTYQYGYEALMLMISILLSILVAKLTGWIQKRLI